MLGPRVTMITGLRHVQHVPAEQHHLLTLETSRAHAGEIPIQDLVLFTYRDSGAQQLADVHRAAVDVDGLDVLGRVITRPTTGVAVERPA